MSVYFNWVQTLNSKGKLENGMEWNFQRSPNNFLNAKNFEKFVEITVEWFELFFWNF